MSQGQCRPTSYKAFTTEQETSGTLKSTRPTSMIIGSRRRWDAQLLLHAGLAQPLKNQALFDSILSLHLMPFISPSLRDSPDPYLSALSLVGPVSPSYFEPASWMPVRGEVPEVGCRQHGSDTPHSIIFLRQRNRHSTKPLDPLALRTLLSIFIPLVLPLLSQEDHLGARDSTSVVPNHILPIRNWSYASSTTEVTYSEAQGRHDREDASHDAGTHRRSADKVPTASRGGSTRSHPRETRKTSSLSELLTFT
jgi:hypothetical protein